MKGITLRILDGLQKLPLIKARGPLEDDVWDRASW